VTSTASPHFWDRYRALPVDIRRLADKSYRLWRANPRYPSLQFKPISNELWFARIGAHYRAVGKFLNGDLFMWIWIGTHEEYNKL
jgi:hypothetical protein